MNSNKCKIYRCLCIFLKQTAYKCFPSLRRNWPCIRKKLPDVFIRDISLLVSASLLFLFINSLILPCFDSIALTVIDNVTLNHATNNLLGSLIFIAITYNLVVLTIIALLVSLRKKISTNQTFNIAPLDCLRKKFSTNQIWNKIYNIIAIRPSQFLLDAASTYILFTLFFKSREIDSDSFLYSIILLVLFIIASAAMESFEMNFDVFKSPSENDKQP